MSQPAFAALPVIDSHVHFVHPERLDEILALMDEGPCARFNLVCIPNEDGSSHNPAAVYFKRRCPERAFISGALEYAPLPLDLDRLAERLAGQVYRLKERGFDGFKFIEGKPQVRKLLPFPLDGPIYAGVWAALEDLNFPVVLHAADPDEFWDPSRCPDWARTSGWDYTGGTFPTKEALYAEVEHILTRHPRMKVILAHFYFRSRDLERAARFLDTHPSACFDLAPHFDMYTDFSRQPEAARAFFIRFQDRILYGTDTDTRVLTRGERGSALMRSVPRTIRALLEYDGPFDAGGSRVLHGLALPPAVLHKIYHANFERLYADRPAPMKE
jgi:predicted TIM-barrel fold metal-dependent hydrolase